MVRRESDDVLQIVSVSYLSNNTNPITCVIQFAAAAVATAAAVAATIAVTTTAAVAAAAAATATTAAADSATAATIVVVLSLLLLCLQLCVVFNLYLTQRWPCVAGIKTNPRENPDVEKGSTGIDRKHLMTYGSEWTHPGTT